MSGLAGRSRKRGCAYVDAPVMVDNTAGRIVAD
jgi:hypothetical protein